MVLRCRVFMLRGDAVDQSDLSKRRLDDRRNNGHDRRRQLLRRSSGRLRQHARLERGIIIIIVVIIILCYISQFNSRLAARGPNSKSNASENCEIVHKNNKNQNKQHT